MSFNTDGQTMDDLGILSKQSKESVFGMYSQTRTRGGAELLSQLFNEPLSSYTQINKRSAVIQFFMRRGMVFPFRNEHFDAVELYLMNTDERTRLQQGERSLGVRLSSLIASDPNYKVVYNGITAFRELLHLLRGFHASLGTVSHEIPELHFEAIRASVGGGSRNMDIEALLSGTAFGALMEKSETDALPYRAVAELDGLLRFGLRQEVQAVLRYLYYIDVYVAVASVAMNRNWVLPKALSGAGTVLRIGGLYHPAVANTVANDVWLEPGKNVVFLTGANMAGKSTFMKSLGIAVFLAHLGFPVAAVKMEFTVLQGMYTTINLPDNLGMGVSHFFAEVLRVKKVAKELAAGKRLLVIFDELFRGTNVVDAHEATVAITGAFAQKSDSLFIISTHIIEAGAELKKDHANIVFLYLPTQMEGNTPVYTYLLQPGITDDRHGMVIINNEGILDILKKGLVERSEKAISDEFYSR